MNRKRTRWIIVFVLLVIVLAAILIFRRTFPDRNSDSLLSASISIDSIAILGPTVVIYDSASRNYYWLKSINSLDMSRFDTLKTKKADILYMKFLMGPFENRIYHMEVDSILLVDQTVE